MSNIAEQRSPDMDPSTGSDNGGSEPSPPIADRDSVEHENLEQNVDAAGIGSQEHEPFGSEAAEYKLGKEEPQEVAESGPDSSQELDLRGRAMLMQRQLEIILDTVAEIKKSCTRLQTENRFIQEYIETLMARR